MFAGQYPFPLRPSVSVDIGEPGTYNGASRSPQTPRPGRCALLTALTRPRSSANAPAGERSSYAENGYFETRKSLGHLGPTLAELVGRMELPKAKGSGQAAGRAPDAGGQFFWLLSFEAWPCSPMAGALRKRTRKAFFGPRFGARSVVMVANYRFPVLLLANRRWPPRRRAVSRETSPQLSPAQRQSSKRAPVEPCS